MNTDRGLHRGGGQGGLSPPTPFWISKKFHFTGFRPLWKEKKWSPPLPRTNSCGCIRPWTLQLNSWIIPLKALSRIPRPRASKTSPCPTPCSSFASKQWSKEKLFVDFLSASSDEDRMMIDDAWISMMLGVRRSSSRRLKGRTLTIIWNVKIRSFRKITFQL